MSRRYVVQQGDCLWSIARDFGLHEWRLIYDHADNEDLGRHRPDPNILLPGDEIAIPEPHRGTDQQHRFSVRQLKPRTLNIALKDSAGNILANEPYELTVEGVLTHGTTSAGGKIQAELGPEVTSAALSLPNHPHVTWDLSIACLDPVSDPVSQQPIATGMQARLGNLSYPCGAADGDVGPLTTRAIAQFQKLEMKRDPADGVPDSAFCDTLMAAYGS